MASAVLPDSREVCVAFTVTKASGKPYDADWMFVRAFHGALSCLFVRVQKNWEFGGLILPKKIGQGVQTLN